MEQPTGRGLFPAWPDPGSPRGGPSKLSKVIQGEIPACALSSNFAFPNKAQERTRSVLPTPPPCQHLCFCEASAADSLPGEETKIDPGTDTERQRA